MSYVHTDGGRAAAGYKGSAGDCVCRAISIATNIGYEEIYKMLSEENKASGKPKSARNGVHKDVYARVLVRLGWKRNAAPKFIGRRARAADMPSGVVIAGQAKHLVAVVDGVIHDTFDSSFRSVYSYWTKE